MWQASPAEGINTGAATHTRTVPPARLSMTSSELSAPSVSSTSEEVVSLPVSSSNLICMGTGLANKRLLRRKGSDTVELMKNEQALANDDSDSKICGIMNMGSETTTFTSLDSSPSLDPIPYIDHTSSSDDDIMTVL